MTRNLFLAIGVASLLQVQPSSAVDGRASLAAAGIDPKEAVPHIAPLLDLPLGDRYPVSSLPPDQQRRKLLTTLVAWVFAAAFGWTEQRKDHVRTIIVAHMWGETPWPAQDPESHLLHLATGFDISGRNPDLWPTELREKDILQHR